MQSVPSDTASTRVRTVSAELGRATAPLGWAPLPLWEEQHGGRREAATPREPASQPWGAGRLAETTAAAEAAGVTRARRTAKHRAGTVAVMAASMAIWI